MKLVGMMPVRNEDWVLGLSLRAALLFLDEVMVLDHGSSDRTPELLARITAEHPGRVHRLAESDAVWRETAIRNRLLAAARQRGATHLCALDADEVLTGNLLPGIRGSIAALAPGETLWLPWLSLWRGLDRYRDDESEVATDCWMMLGWRDDPAVHYRNNQGEFDIHSRRVKGQSGTRRIGRDKADGGVFHLAFANWRRLRVKTAWYKMMETVRYPGLRTAAQLNQWYACDVDEGGLRTSAVAPEWWEPYRAWRGEVALDGEPWHESECRQLWQRHGPTAFAGLDLWGVPESPPAARATPIAAIAGER
jgi:glycosyltransferase involved in cell wall biosynthesis